LSQPLPRSRSERTECADCGLSQSLPNIAVGEVAQCMQCGKVLKRRSRGGIDVPLTLALTSLLLLIPANAAPLMSVAEHGAQRQNWLSTGVAMLWSSGFESLAILVAAFTIVFPLVYLALLVTVLGSIRFGGPPRLGRLFRWTEYLRPWMMV